jgi:prepilin peptidase CpaA
MLACFLVLQVGGGDVKLVAMLGAFLGPERGIEAMLWTFVLGAGAALVVLVWRVGPWRLLAQVFRHLFWMLRLGQWVPLTADERRQLQPPLFLAPSALAAVVIVVFFHSLGSVI